MEDLAQIIAQIEEAWNANDKNFLEHTFNDMDAADIAECLSNLETTLVLNLFKLIHPKRQAEVFSFLELETQEELIEQLPEALVAAVLNEMEAVDRTQFLEDLNFVIRDRLLRKMTAEERLVALRLLSYPEDSVGRLMDPDFLSLKASMLAHQAIEYLRWFSSHEDKDIHLMFVTDNEGKYIGDVNLSQLVISPSQKIEEIMNPIVSALNPFDDRESAVDHFRKYDRNLSPVVDENNVIIGVVSSDDVFDVAEEEATQDIQQFGGQAVLEDSYFATPFFTLMRKRGVWLCLLFVGEMFTVAAMRHYEDAISSMRYLVYFVPLIIASGGNSGTQAASLVIRGLAVREMQIKDWHRVFFREALTGLLLGGVLGVMGYVRAISWGQPQSIGLIIFVTLVCVVTFGATLGSMLPFLLKRMKIDPAISSSPFIACTVDCVGILIYFGVATAVMNHLSALNP